MPISQHHTLHTESIHRINWFLHHPFFHPQQIILLPYPFIINLFIIRLVLRQYLRSSCIGRRAALFPTPRIPWFPHHTFFVRVGRIYSRALLYSIKVAIIITEFLRRYFSDAYSIPNSKPPRSRGAEVNVIVPIHHT